ncbi:MAG: hypothetical protein ACJA16_002377 [Akkermansiaceae bacterium]|jgi:hypothetical protein
MGLEFIAIGQVEGAGAAFCMVTKSSDYDPKFCCTEGDAESETRMPVFVDD